MFELNVTSLTPLIIFLLLYLNFRRVTESLIVIPAIYALVKRRQLSRQAPGTLPASALDL